MKLIPSLHSVGETLDRLEAALKSHGVLVFARIDFAVDAAKVGLSLRPEQLLLFGNPKGGTPLMMESASVGIDLPFKALAFEAPSAQVYLGYNEPAWIVARHGLAADLARNFTPLIALLEQAAA